MFSILFRNNPAKKTNSRDVLWIQIYEQKVHAYGVAEFRGGITSWARTVSYSLLIANFCNVGPQPTDIESAELRSDPAK